MVTRSSKARLQRKRMYNAPTHVKSAACVSHLSEDLRSKYGMRSARVCKGDTVVVLRGNEDIRGIEGKVIEVLTKDNRVVIEGITIKQADGTAVARPVHTSNLVIIKLDLSDDWRKDILSKKKKEAKQ